MQPEKTETGWRQINGRNHRMCFLHSEPGNKVVGLYYENGDYNCEIGGYRIWLRPRRR